jgi:hypothetical protein
MSTSVPSSSAAIENPECSIPFQFDIPNGDIIMVEQGTDADVANRIWICLSYAPGVYTPDPTFGIPEPTFAKQGANLTLIEQTIRNNVPDANELITRNPDWFETLVDQITIQRNLPGLT